LVPFHDADAFRNPKLYNTITSRSAGGKRNSMGRHQKFESAANRESRKYFRFALTEVLLTSGDPGNRSSLL
jgi:hypothetical protein